VVIETLYANGCSWTAGNGIEQDPSLSHLPLNGRFAILKNYVWPTKLASLLEIPEVINDAEGAGSNARMVRTTIQYIQSIPKSKHKNLLVVLGWTTVDRNELFFHEGDIKGWCKFNATQLVSSHAGFRPNFSKSFLNKIDDWQKTYVAEFYNVYSHYFRYYQELYLMKNLLNNLKIKHLFFNSLNGYYIPTTIDYKKEFANEIENIQSPNILCTRDCDDSKNVMVEFCIKNNIPLSTCMHPMVLGHQMWALHLYREIKELYG
jgi:hypothetical protein